MQMAKLMDWKTVNEGSSLEEKFHLEVEFQKKGHVNDQSEQVGTSAEFDQQEGETQLE